MKCGNWYKSPGELTEHKAEGHSGFIAKSILHKLLSKGLVYEGKKHDK